MPWFHPKTLLDKTYEIGIIIKGFDGTVEILTALLLIFLTPAAFVTLMSHLGNSGKALSEHKLSAILFLMSHGIVKVVLVTCLLLNKLWAYPWALVALGIFTAIQIYQIFVSPSLGIIALTILNVAIMFLIYREWQKARTHKLTPEPAK